MRIQPLPILVLVCQFVAAGCESPALVEPERDLTREYEAEISRLRSLAHEYCAEAGEEVGTLQIRVKRTDDGALARMEAICDGGNSEIRCTLTTGAGTTPECSEVDG